MFKQKTTFSGGLSFGVSKSCDPNNPSLMNKINRDEQTQVGSWPRNKHLHNNQKED